MITSFVNSAIVIDDKPQEVEGLLNVLNGQDIAYSSFTPTKLNTASFKKNRQLIFLDLSLDDSKKPVENIALIRSLLKKTLGTAFGNYGIVMWTKHSGHVDSLKEKMQEDRKNDAYTTPLFIVGLDKMKYIQAGDFNTLFTDIETELKQDAAATFFLEWSNFVERAKDKTIENIYSLMPDYKNQSDDITFILTKLALNHIGIDKIQVGKYPLHIDAFKSFDEILAGELINSHVSSSTSVVDITKTFSKPNDLTNIYAYLNSAILIDNNNLDQNVVVPGNIYEINENNNFKCFTDKELIEPKIKDKDKPTNEEQKIIKEYELRKGCKRIAMEITPPCDFSNSGKRVRARLVGGFIVDATNAPKKKIEDLKCKKECFYSEVYPIMISGHPNPQLLILDFRYFGAEEDVNLQDPSKYKILFRAKPKLFADVLQKFSAHTARLGLSVIHYP
jgi:hypothetical protein